MIKAVVFDLGGVLVKLSSISQVFGPDIENCDKNFWHNWLHSDVVRRFETGASLLEEFISDIKAELGLSFSEAELTQRHRSFVQGLYPGTYELLEQLRDQYSVVSLSNNNPVHWPIMMEDYDLEHRFDHHFPSHMTSLIKPDHSAFENVIQKLAIQPNEMLFVDDNVINVEAAKKLGIDAYVTKGIDEVTKLLREQKLIA